MLSNAFGLVTTKTPTQKKEEDANRRKTLESNGQTISDTDWNNYLIARKYYTLNPSEYISDKTGTPYVETAPSLTPNTNINLSNSFLSPAI